jgi:hypothetical protein
MTGPVATLGGKQSTVTIVLGTDGCPDDAPFVGASELGGSPLGHALENHHVATELERLVERMRASQDGALVALVDAPPSSRRLGIIQSDRSQNPNFYGLNRPDRRLWRDFYYRTTYALLQRVDDAWKSADVELSHPTGFDWPPDLVTTVLEALGHLADDSALSVQRVHLSCLHRLDERGVVAAMRRLNNEQSRVAPPLHREIDATQVSVEDLLDSPAAGAYLFKVAV